MHDLVILLLSAYAMGYLWTLADMIRTGGRKRGPFWHPWTQEDFLIRPFGWPGLLLRWAVGLLD